MLWQLEFQLKGLNKITAYSIKKGTRFSACAFDQILV